MLPEQDWLEQAKRLSVGMQIKVRHRSETRSNLTIANAPDKWWAWCHRCHEGAVVDKEHVLLGVGTGPVDMEVKLPPDIKPVLRSEFELTVERFLASKCMSSMYLPPLHYSESRKRLMLLVDGCWHGRDLTGRSPMKWMNYSYQQLCGYGKSDGTITVEDLFSYFKVRWALRNHPQIGVVCLLGTQPKAGLIKRAVSPLLWFLDGDSAGDEGCSSGQRRLRPFMQHQYRVRPPEGKDPKDMPCEVIRQEVLNAICSHVHPEVPRPAMP